MIYVAPLLFGKLESEDNGIQTLNDVRTNKEIKVDIEKAKIRKEKNKDLKKSINMQNWNLMSKNTSKLSEQSNKKVETTSVLVSVAPTICEVYNESSFCKIGLGGGIPDAYGGNQAWLSGNYNADTSCGVVAASNITAYWAKNKSAYDDLYPYIDLTSTSFNKYNFIAHMQKLYDNIRPSGIIGTPSLSYFDSGLTKYQNSVTSTKLTKTNISTGTYAKFVTSIKTGLSYKAPIVMLTYFENGTFPDPESFNFHWITITKYYKDNNIQTEYFACSSWGLKYSLYLYDYYLSYDFMEGAYYK